MFDDREASRVDVVKGCVDVAKGCVVGRVKWVSKCARYSHAKCIHLSVVGTCSLAVVAVAVATSAPAAAELSLDAKHSEMDPPGQIHSIAGETKAAADVAEIRCCLMASPIRSPRQRTHSKRDVNH